MVKKIEANTLSNPADRKKLKKVLQDCSEGLTRIEAEKGSIKQVVDDICEELSLDKKTVNKMVKVFYKQSFNEEVFEHDSFEALYFLVVQPTQEDDAK